MRPLVLRGFVRQQLQEHLALLWIGGFGQSLPKELEVLFVDKLFHELSPLGKAGGPNRRPNDQTRSTAILVWLVPQNYDGASGGHSIRTRSLRDCGALAGFLGYSQYTMKDQPTPFRAPPTGFSALDH